MRRVARAVIAAVFVLVASGGLLVVSANAAPVPPSTVVPYGAGDYRYSQIPSGANPANFADISFDDTSFAQGAAPFGTDQFDCGYAPVTTWAPESDLLVRRTVTLPVGTTDVRVHIAVDNDVTVYWNGTPMGSFVHEGCPTRAGFEVVVPAALITAGDNVLAAHASDRGGTSLLDLQVTANLPPLCDGIVLDQTELWPPRHGMELATTSGAVDPEGGALTITVTGVTQDEPLDGRGDGATAPDASTGSYATASAPSGSVSVRAERAGSGDGRVYHVTLVAEDDAGAPCTVTRTIGVPHDQRKGHAAVDTTDVVVDSLGVPALSSASPTGGSPAVPEHREITVGPPAAAPAMGTSPTPEMQVQTVPVPSTESPE
jgi:hypothetical protein